MADYGIKISKAGTDVKTAPTSSTKKNYTILSTDTVPKVSTQAVVSSDTNVAHGLGFIPMWDAYILQDSLTEAHPVTPVPNQYWDISADDTYLYCNEIWGSYSVFYIIYLDEP
jgi:hypothetical protein